MPTLTIFLSLSKFDTIDYYSRNSFMHNLEKWPNILRCSHHKIFEVCLTIFNIRHGWVKKGSRRRNKNTAWKVSVFGVFLVRTFPHSEWIWRDTPYLSVFSLNGGKFGLEKLRIWTLYVLKVFGASIEIARKITLTSFGYLRRVSLQKIKTEKKY